MAQTLERRSDVPEPAPHLREVTPNLPLLADLMRCDVTLYALDESGSVTVLAEANPATVPSVYTGPRLGRRIGFADEPAVMRVLSTGRPARRLSRVLVHGAPTVQDVFPVQRDGATIAAVVCEMGLIEHERQRRKSPVFLRAVDRFRSAALAGAAVGCDQLSRLGEHDGPLVVDVRGTITYISTIAEGLYRKLGYTHSLMRRSVAQLHTDESAFFEALETGRCVEKVSTEGDLIWQRWALPVPADGSGPLLRRFGLNGTHRDEVLLVVRDITEDRIKDQALLVKSAMIQEIHHRVKNNLQTIASLLRLQARRTGSIEVGDMLRQSINRILSIALVHEFLSAGESDVIEVKEVCLRILSEVTQGILDPEKRIRFVVEGHDMPMPAQQATSCALIVNELLQNAVKHAFVGRSEGSVVVNLRDDGDVSRIEIVDDGRGVGPGFDHRHQGSLGLQIVRTLVREDLRGDFGISVNDPAGVRATITFPRMRAR